MGRVLIETWIAAPRERVFDLARDVSTHLQTMSSTAERAVSPGRTSGLLELGEVVTFEGVHFGVRQRLTAKIVQMERPRFFVDEMQKGAFKRLRHLHEFESARGGTLMRDTLEWTSPFGLLGTLVDRIAVTRHLHKTLTTKQSALKKMAESGEKPY